MRPSKPSLVTPDEVCRRHVEALARSGQTVPAYAREHDLKPDTLCRWRRRFPPSAQEAVGMRVIVAAMVTLAVAGCAARRP